jgi:hypothetical protein
MAIENTDLLYVQRPEGGDAGAYKIEYEDLKDAIVAEVPDPPDPVDAYTKTESDAKYFPFAGGNLTGAATQTEVAITAGGWDLSTANFFSCGAIAVPNPTEGVNGQSGLIRFTDVPTSLGDQLILPSGFNITAACIVPFYVRAADEILLGNPVEVS